MTEPATVAELFARDPLKLTKSDIDTIISELRKKRANYMLGEKGAGSMKPAKTAAKPKAKATSADLAALMKDLGL